MFIVNRNVDQRSSDELEFAQWRHSTGDRPCSDIDAQSGLDRLRRTIGFVFPPSFVVSRSTSACHHTKSSYQRRQKTE